MAVKTEIARSLRQLHLPAFVDNYGVQATVATNEGWAYDRYLVALCELELEERRQRKIERLLRESKLPREKTWAAFEQSRLPRTVERRVDALLDGDFLDRTENVLAFLNPFGNEARRIHEPSASLRSRSACSALATIFALLAFRASSSVISKSFRISSLIFNFNFAMPRLR